jgi:hypothetical protein
MPSIINSDDGVISGSSGLETTGGNDGITVFQQNGVERMRIDSSGVITSSLGGVQVTSGTAVTASSTSVDFTGIPSWVKRITVMLSGVSTNGTSAQLIQIGDAGGIENTGYIGTGTSNSTGANPVTANFTAGFGLNSASVAAQTQQGIATIVLLDAGTNTWAFSFVGGRDNAVTVQGAGAKSLSGTLDRVRITTVNGTDVFDAGTINILYE